MRITRFYSTENANIHRGVHCLSERRRRSTTRPAQHVARFLNAPSRAEHRLHPRHHRIDQSRRPELSAERSQPGDEILITAMEHHSNIVPWQLVGRATGAVLRARRSPMRVSWISTPSTGCSTRALGSSPWLISPMRWAPSIPCGSLPTLRTPRECRVLVDGAQSAPHLGVDVQALDCDFFACSGHKMYGPTGVGVLYGREELLERMPPWQGGGDMIASVTLERSTWAPVPAKFEAGTPMIAEVIGLGAALDYVESVGLPAIASWEDELLAYATAQVSEIPGVRLIGTARRKASVLSFVRGRGASARCGSRSR